MILLGTNVISETLRPRPDPLVIEWLNAKAPEELFLCTPVLAELYYGAARLVPSERQRKLQRLIAELTTELFPQRMLPFDREAASEYGWLVAEREKAGRLITVMDAQIAAIAKSNSATFATRNVADFELTGITLVNPFSDSGTP